MLPLQCHADAPWGKKHLATAVSRKLAQISFPRHVPLQSMQGLSCLPHTAADAPLHIRGELQNQSRKGKFVKTNFDVGLIKPCLKVKKLGLKLLKF